MSLVREHFYYIVLQSTRCSRHANRWKRDTAVQWRCAFMQGPPAPSIASQNGSNQAHIPHKCHYLHIAQVSAFVTPGSAKFLLLHEGKSDDAIKHFFNEVYELYLRISLNPFHSPASKLTSREFDRKVRAACRKTIG